MKLTDSDVTCWDCEDGADVLRHESVDEALGEYLDDYCGDIEPGTKVEVFAYVREDKPDVDTIIKRCWPLDQLTERFQEAFEELCHPDRPVEQTEGMKAAERAFVEAFLAEHQVWACSQVPHLTKTIDLYDWAKKNAPEGQGL